MRFNILILTTFFFFGATLLLRAQEQETLFPGTEGQELLLLLANDFKPSNVLDYDEARKYLYKTVYNSNDSVKCVYTGHSLYLPPNHPSPIFSLSNLGSSNGIITEHTYPQSKGAEFGNANSDMHHLVPARLSANVFRLNYPFSEIDDNETQAWLINDLTLYSKPSANLHKYSEQKIGQFEPKEQHKGNAARMVFYFYTMYQEEAMAADSDFFSQQKTHYVNGKA